MCIEDKAVQQSGQGGTVEDLHKTELKEVDGDVGGQVVSTDKVMAIMVEMAKRAALAMIQDELKLYQALMDEAGNMDDKLKVVREIADLKLRSTGICIAGMRMSGQIEVKSEKPVSPE